MLEREPGEQLVLLARDGDLAGVKRLLDTGVDVNYANKVGRSSRIEFQPKCLDLVLYGMRLCRTASTRP